MPLPKRTLPLIGSPPPKAPIHSRRWFPLRVLHRPSQNRLQSSLSNRSSIAFRYETWIRRLTPNLSVCVLFLVTQHPRTGESSFPPLPNRSIAFTIAFNRRCPIVPQSLSVKLGSGCRLEAAKVKVFTQPHYLHRELSVSISAYGDTNRIPASVQQGLNSTGIALNHV
ncbi:hypothetical protein Ccrd_022324 [Cynara cardunculus var. scolymus]|uniref:Uncharacterized protein n=1 Tax=Cynara cardunculus var. scolymus TaxID=59895 RepID=A0A124SEA1_CYNCS|nr:hypothetical protein Ccrd_022324 [Cynara cardunculus var. scolymus]